MLFLYAAFFLGCAGSRWRVASPFFLVFWPFEKSLTDLDVLAFPCPFSFFKDGQVFVQQGSSYLPWGGFFPCSFLKKRGVVGFLLVSFSFRGFRALLSPTVVLLVGFVGEVFLPVCFLVWGTGGASLSFSPFFLCACWGSSVAWGRKRMLRLKSRQAVVPPLFFQLCLLTWGKDRGSIDRAIGRNAMPVGRKNFFVLAFVVPAFG